MNEFYNHHHGRPEPHPEYRPTPPFHDHPDPGYCIPPIPPCKPYVPGFSPEEQMALLTGKVNEMIDLFNRSQMDMWGAYHTIVESALTNDAYYNEITVEEGYIAEAGAPYKVVHIPFLDRAKQPIYLELGLAYNNTTNANVHEDVFSASERVLADKLIPAYQSTNTWYGAVVWKGAPISNIGENPAPYTVGITENGFIKIYENLTNYTQLKQDNVRNAMLANCVLVQGGAMTPDKFEPDEKGQMLGRVGIGMNYDTKERFMVIVNGSDQSGCTAEMLANIFLKYNCTVAVEVANGMKTVGVDKGALMFTPPTVAGDEVPTIPEINAFWYITKRRHYKNEYVKDVASLTQKYGQMLWRCETANISVDNVKEVVAELSQKLDAEINDRQEADAHLQEQITQEVADREQGDETLDNRITQEVQTLNERIDTEVQTLNKLIADTKEELQTNIDTLEAKVEQYHTELDNADIASVDILQDGTKDTYRLKRKDGTYVDIPIEVYNYELLLQKLDTLSALEPRLEQEIAAREAGDNALSARIDTLTQDTTDADNEIKEQLNQETQARTAADTQLQSNIDAEALARQTADNQEATARQEADNALGQRIDELQADIGADYVEKAGSTMTGELVLFGDPTQNLGAATKQYVDNITAQAVDAEAQERQKQDDLLEGLINQEAQTREQADTALDTRLSGVESAMTQFDNKVVVVGDTTLISEGVTAIGDGKIVYWVREGKKSVVLTAYDADAVTFSGYTTELPAFVTYKYENTGVAFSTGVEAIICPVVGTPTDANQAVSKEYADTISETLESQIAQAGNVVIVTADTTVQDILNNPNKVFILLDYGNNQGPSAFVSVIPNEQQYIIYYIGIRALGLSARTANSADEKILKEMPVPTFDVYDTFYLNYDSGAPYFKGTDKDGNILRIKTATPTDDDDAANKAYVDQHAGGGSGDFKADGSVTATGDFNMGGHAITNVEAPVNDTDVANKQYIDTEISDAVTEVKNQFEQAQNVVIFDYNSTLQDVVDNNGKIMYYYVPNIYYPMYIFDASDGTIFISFMGCSVSVGSGNIGNVGVTGWCVSTKDMPMTTTLNTIFNTRNNSFDFNRDIDKNSVYFGSHTIIKSIATPVEDNDAANKKYVDDAIAASAGASAFTVTASTTLSQIASAANDGAVIHVDSVTVDSVVYNGVATVSNDGTNISVTCGDLYVRGTGTQTLVNATTRWKFSSMINTTVLTALYS